MLSKNVILLAKYSKYVLQVSRSYVMWVPHKLYNTINGYGDPNVNEIG